MNVKELQKQIVEGMERWERIEDAALVATSRVMEKTQNPFVFPCPKDNRDGNNNQSDKERLFPSHDPASFLRLTLIYERVKVARASPAAAIMTTLSPIGFLSTDSP